MEERRRRKDAYLRGDKKRRKSDGPQRTDLGLGAGGGIMRSDEVCSGFGLITRGGLLILHTRAVAKHGIIIKRLLS